MVSQKLLGRHQVKPVSIGLKAKGKQWFFKQRLVTLVTSVQQDAAGAGTLRWFRIGWINSQKEKNGKKLLNIEMPLLAWDAPELQGGGEASTSVPHPRCGLRPFQGEA